MRRGSLMQRRSTIHFVSRPMLQPQCGFYTFTSTNTTLRKVRTFDLEHFLLLVLRFLGQPQQALIRPLLLYLLYFPTYSIHYGCVWFIS